jgi:two-component system, cell cycle sensor histidine kinase and response regulator CckA
VPTEGEPTTLVTTVEPIHGDQRVTARLVCVAGPDLGRVFVVDGPEITIGRGEVDVFLRGPDVSRLHARLVTEAATTHVHDAGSANGTFVNGERITGPTELAFGDRIQIAKTVLVFTHHDEVVSRMQQLQRVDAMTAVASGVAADFRNMLQVLVLGIDEIAEHDGPVTEKRATIEGMRRAAAAAVGFANRLARLAEHDLLDDELIELRPLVLDTIETFRPLLGEAIVVRTELASGLEVRGSRDELRRMLMSLYANARDAMPVSGELVISAQPVDRERGLVLATRGEFVQLRVVDSGGGMSEAARERCFEPLYTTKRKTHKAVGLGLTAVHAIVTRHRGSLALASTERGTTIDIWLPRASAVPG